MSARQAPRTRPESPAKARVFWEKAQRFAGAASANAADGVWDPAVANAVNAVINLTDALVVHYLGVRSTAGSHAEVLNLLATAKFDAAMKEALSRHLVALLDVKGGAQYEGRLLTENECDRALAHMERAFEAVSPIAKQNAWPTA